MKKNEFERLKELEKKKKRLAEFYSQVKSYPYLCLSKHPSKDKDFWDQDDRSKRVTGMPQIIDLPDSVELKAMVMKAIEEKEKEIEREFKKIIE